MVSVSSGCFSRPWEQEEIRGYKKDGFISAEKFFFVDLF